MDVDQERLGAVCERYGVASLEVFGSVARSEKRQDSDVDLLYVLKPNARLGFRLFDLEDGSLPSSRDPSTSSPASRSTSRSASRCWLRRSRSMRRKLLLLREMRDAAVAIRDVVGDRTARRLTPTLCGVLRCCGASLCSGRCQPEPVKTKDAHPQIAWRAATRLLNRIVHGH